MRSSTSQDEGSFPPEKTFELGFGLGGQGGVHLEEKKMRGRGKREENGEGQEPQEQRHSNKAHIYRMACGSLWLGG